ncbi:hypothetical protein DYB37_004305 [Aphanomyces astaci]|uniref:Uncharacterized protein n=1 Tax=Aphanomyces astaci TaxID=112090 RepID=A0A3R6XL56_APHAT|nr:hypothetical protein DYB37_004305 [Aphanomyces astaci]
MSSQQAIRAQNDYIFNLQVQADKYARLISSVNLRIKTIDEEWKTVREKLAELRLKRNEGDQRGGGINAVKSKIMSESREVGKLENRLASCRTRLSNMNLEEQDAFDEIYQNLAIVITREKENSEAFRKEAMKSEALDTHEDGYFRGNFRIDEESEMKQTLQKLDVAIIEQRSNDLVEQFTRRLQHKHPQNLATTSLGAHLQPSDPNRANGLHLNFNLNQAPPLLTSHDANSGDPDNNSGDEDDSLVPVSTAELQRKAAKTLAMQLSNAKMSPTRNKKKKNQK